MRKLRLDNENLNKRLQQLVSIVAYNCIHYGNHHNYCIRYYKWNDYLKIEG